MEGREMWAQQLKAQQAAQEAARLEEIVAELNKVMRLGLAIAIIPTPTLDPNPNSGPRPKCRATYVSWS